MQQITEYIAQNQERFINELIELLKIPSVSADPAFTHDVLQTAEAVKTALEQAGCDIVEIHETEGYPIVYGEKTIDSKLADNSGLRPLRRATGRPHQSLEFPPLRTCGQGHRHPSRGRDFRQGLLR